MIKQELTGMLQAAIGKIEELWGVVAALNPSVLRGYDSTAGKDSYFYWGVACRIKCTDMAALRSSAEALGFVWLSADGDMAYTNGLSVNNFQTYRVNGNIELMPEEEA